ncbi:hypothetical protein PMG11_03863 [Penicillium brasilianum]|uniref:N-acetyltransferase domain-containing protein n=1 Tax=Penicillium brasilianum TaxID=104259 RepID=A0A0F7VB87_PENBI|nr:hypothetical protein PMG11_03863 [Penicillium brasilianum]
MPFEIQPCSAADALGLAITMMSARLTDPHWAFLWEDPNPKDIITKSALRVPWNLATGRDTKRHQKVIDVESGQVVGYARWILPDCLAKQNDVWLEAQAPEGTRSEREEWEIQHKANTRGGQPIGMKSGGLMSYRSAPLEVIDARIMRDGPFLILDYLTTDPAFWRRGIASMLVQSGLKVGDQYGMKVYVMSEPAALKLYLNHGFELLETVSTDYSIYGGTEPTVEHFLVRVPRSVV